MRRDNPALRERMKEWHALVKHEAHQAVGLMRLGPLTNRRA